MKFDQAGLLWAMDTLTNSGHQDPEGLIARIESSKDTGNMTGISKEEAAQVGIKNINEPVMSMFAAAQYDSQTGRRYRVSDSTRANINQRVDEALFSGVQPVNPFLDQQGHLTLHHQPKHKTVVVDDEKLLTEIYDLMEATI